MPNVKDRVKDTTTSTGTTDVTLSGTAPSGFQTFATAFPLGVAFGYCITGGAEWETGVGYLSASTTLVRNEPFDGSAGVTTLVTFSAGSKDVFCTAPAHLLMDANSGAIIAKVRGYDLQ